MEKDYRKPCSKIVVCPVLSLGLVQGESTKPTCGPPPVSADAGGAKKGIAFDTAPQARIHLESHIPIPGFNAPSLPAKPMRDPSLSLIALSGVDPTEPVMVEVPLVQNDTTRTATPLLAGTRVGFADRYQQGDAHASIEHSASFMRALERLRRGGALLFPVSAQRLDASLQFDLHTRNEIDDLINQYRLDALVSDSRSGAFHAACWAGYPKVGEPLEDGATLWFYGARWSRDSLAALAQAYRNAARLTSS